MGERECGLSTTGGMEMRPVELKTDTSPNSVKTYSISKSNYEFGTQYSMITATDKMQQNLFY